MTSEFQTDGVFDVYKMLDIIRERPGIYLGQKTLTHLKWFIEGYQAALIDNDVPYRKVAFWDNPKFHTWVGRHFGVYLNMSYHQIIL